VKLNGLDRGEWLPPGGDDAGICLASGLTAVAGGTAVFGDTARVLVSMLS
jgi:hypothetical protein